MKAEEEGGVRRVGAEVAGRALWGEEGVCAKALRWEKLGLLKLLKGSQRGCRWSLFRRRQHEILTQNSFTFISKCSLFGSSESNTELLK